MKYIPQGCVLLARKITDSEIWVTKPAWWFKVWTHLLLEVNHADNRYFKRGENMFTRKDIHLNCHLTLDGVGIEAIENFFKFLRKHEMITTQKTTRGLVITITKYDEYQNMGSYQADSQNHTENQKGTTQEPDRSQTINKNDKNEKNERKERTVALEILAILNQESKSRFQDNDVNLGFIEARLKEKGVTKEICVQIIKLKTWQWLTKPTKDGLDPTQAEYLRPATLFNRTKFWQYHGQVLAILEKRKEKEAIAKRQSEQQHQDKKELADETRMTKEETREMLEKHGFGRLIK